VGHVRDLAALLVQAGLHLGGLGLQGGDALLQGLALVDELLAGLGLQLALHRGGVVVPPLPLVLEGAQGGVPAVVELDDEVGVGLHVAVGDVLLDRAQVVLDELVVEHDGPY